MLDNLRNNLFTRLDIRKGGSLVSTIILILVDWQVNLFKTSASEILLVFCLQLIRNNLFGLELRFITKNLFKISDQSFLK